MKTPQTQEHPNMITKFFTPLLATLACLSIVPLTWAATKDEYREASVKGLRETLGRAKGTVKHVLEGARDGKIAVIGRGEIMLISQLLLAGRQTNDAEFLGLARDLALACNKAALDGYDTPQLNSLEQIGFSLRELALAVPQLKALKLLTPRDAQRADETLRKAADFLPQFKPEPGDGNIAQRYALGVATVCRPPLPDGLPSQIQRQDRRWQTLSGLDHHGRSHEYDAERPGLAIHGAERPQRVAAGESLDRRVAGKSRGRPEALVSDRARAPCRRNPFAPE